MENSHTHTHIGWIDWARDFGALSIVLLHVIVAYFNIDGAKSLYPSVYLGETALSIPLFRWAVPVFFMISGTLLLDPKKEINHQKILHYLGRIVLLLATFGYFFCLLELGFDAGSMAELLRLKTIINIFWQAFLSLIQGKSWDHLWYLYAMLLIYIFLIPIRFIREELYARTKHAATFELLILILFGCLSLDIRYLYMSQALLGDHIWGHPFFLAIYKLFPLIYFCLGRWLYEHGRINAISISLGLISLGLVLYFLFTKTDYVGIRAMLPEYGLILPYSALIYLVLKRFATRPIQAFPVMQAIAKASLGIYILHPLFMHIMLIFGKPLELPIWLVQGLMAIISLVLSLYLTRLLQKTKLFRHAL